MKYLLSDIEVPVLVLFVLKLVLHPWPPTYCTTGSLNPLRSCFPASHVSRLLAVNEKEVLVGSWKARGRGHSFFPSQTHSALTDAPPGLCSLITQVCSSSTQLFPLLHLSSSFCGSFQLMPTSELPVRLPSFSITSITSYLIKSIHVKHSDCVFFLTQRVANLFRKKEKILAPSPIKIVPFCT